jgi:2-hydroxychromene-2-carboxylate isomerase
MRSIRFYFDFISPYAYLASTQLDGIAARTGVRIERVPVLFAALLDAHGQKGPAEIPAKRQYTWKDVYRKCHALGVPIAPPPSHPFNPLLGLRVASLELDDDARARVVAAIYQATWGGGGGIERPESVAAALTRAGFDGAAMVARAGDPEVKACLRAQTERALAAGVFGVPTLEIDGELFWGTDSLPFAEAYLRGEDPIPADFAWVELPATAIRPGSRR